MKVQLIDTAGWIKKAARQQQQSPALQQSPQTTTSSSSSSKSSSKGSQLQTEQQQQQQQGLVGGVTSSVSPLSPEVQSAVTAASLQQAQRAMAAAHVVVLLLDATRLLQLNQVCFSGGKGGRGWRRGGGDMQERMGLGLMSVASCLSRTSVRGPLYGE